MPLHLHLFKHWPKGFHKWKGGLKWRTRTRGVLRACCLSLITHFPSQPLFLTGRASYRSMLNLLVPTPTFHSVPSSTAYTCDKVKISY